MLLHKLLSLAPANVPGVAARLAEKAATPPRPERVGAIDAYRGLVMILLLGEVLQFCAVSTAIPGSVFWSFLCSQQSHAPWVGCSIHDIGQPSFMFLVGVVMPISIAKRMEKGQRFPALFGHALLRAGILVTLGVALISIHPRSLIWHFEDTLTQIGLAYGFVFLLNFRSTREVCIALAIVLIGYWSLFAFYPLPPPDFDYAKTGVPAEWLSAYGLEGFARHWQINSNPAWAFDVWFMNLFPQDAVHTGYPHGLTTLNFVPTMGTMILGVLAGRLLKSEATYEKKLGCLIGWGLAALLSGLALGVFGICPVVKSIWTPSWVLFSGGLCFSALAGFHVLMNYAGGRRGAFFLVVVGMNPIVAYSLSHIYPALAFNSLRRIFSEAPFLVFGEAFEPLIYGLAVLACYWCCLFVLYKLKWFVKI